MKRLILLLCLFTGLITKASAQDDYLNSEQAQFPGGQADMERSIKRNIDTSLLNKLDPFFVEHSNKEVICSFVVDTIGYVKDIKVVKGVHPLLDGEAKRVIGLMPRWEPLRKYDENLLFGKTVDSKCSVSVSFEDPFFKDIIFRKVDKTAEFPGGTDELMKHLDIYVKDYMTPDEYLRFKSNVNDGLSLRAVCNFVIDKEGEIRRLKITRGADPLLDKIALYIISGLPRFIPGENKGEKVCTTYTLSTFFKLSSDFDNVLNETVDSVDKI